MVTYHPLGQTVYRVTRVHYYTYSLEVIVAQVKIIFFIIFSNYITLARPLISLPTGPIYSESGKEVKPPLCQVIGYPPPVVSWIKLFGDLPGGRAR